MKVLTNIRFAQTAGIAQVLLAFMDFVEKGSKKNIRISAVNIIDQKENLYSKVDGKKTSTISIGVNVPKIGRVVEKAKNLADVEKKCEAIIRAYQKSIQEEKPDIILINGTYFMPWCLLRASEREGVPAVLHYHGVLTRETQHWRKHERKIFFDMEKSFDKKDLFYIFPSKITKYVVEKEVFGHKIKRCAILPNPVPGYFFGDKNKAEKRNIGIISRWTSIKNVHFCEKLAEYNKKMGAKFVLNIITDLDKSNEHYKRLSSLVVFHEPKSNKKLVSFYRNMGVIISPSHFETYGNVAKEAIASGTPALVSSNMGVSETFEKLGLNNWITSFNCVKSAYKKIENTIGETVSTDIQGEIKRLYSPNKIFTEIISILGNAV